MLNQQVEPLEQIAYREAGHSVMAYLITKAGVFDDLYLAPIASCDRHLMLTEIEFVSIKAPFHNWGELTFSLRSLTATPRVLLAGYAASRQKYKWDEPFSPHNSTLTRSAWHLLCSYFEEYGTDDMAERDRLATESLKSAYNEVEKVIAEHWHIVQAVAGTLMEETLLVKEQLFAVIDSQLSLETREKVAVIANRTGEAEKRWLKAKELELLDKLKQMTTSMS